MTGLPRRAEPAVAHTRQPILLGRQAKWLADQILTFDLTRQNVIDTLRRKPTSQRERAFAVILRNRVQRGGIMAEGAGLVKTGENGRGLNSRWYPETLARRIQEIAGLRELFSFVEGDAFEVVRRYADEESSRMRAGDSAQKSKPYSSPVP